jgi:ribosomal protein S18 acetylase RimI-like enzyme
MRWLITTTRAWPTIEHEDEEAHWIISHSPAPYFNGLVRANVSPSSASGKIEAMKADLARANVPGTWTVRSKTDAPGIRHQLEAAGFRFLVSEPGMAVDLTTERQDRPALPGLTFRLVENEADLATYVDLLGRGFDDVQGVDNVAEATWLGQTYRRLGLDHPHLRHVLALVDGEAVGQASLLIAGDVTGINYVSTLPEYRGRGIGRALVSNMLERSRASGARVATLISSEAGLPLYRSLGFTEELQLHLYTWRPEPSRR